MHAHPFAGAVVYQRPLHTITTIKFSAIRVQENSVDVGHGVDDGNLVPVSVGVGTERENAEPK